MEHDAVADRARAFAEQLVTAQPPPEVLAEVAALLEEATDLLTAHRPDATRPVYEGFGDQVDYLELFRWTPVIGPRNPVAPRLALSIRHDGPGYGGREVEARLVLGHLHEGPMGMVHGGVIASLFDQLLAIANIDNGFGAFTGTLTVRYRGGCPLGVPLRFACRTDRVEGRKVYARGELYAGETETLVAEGEGVFILPSEAFIAEMLGAAGVTEHDEGVSP